MDDEYVETQFVTNSIRKNPFYEKNKKEIIR